MHLHAQHLNGALKPRKRMLSREKLRGNQSLAQSHCLAIMPTKQMHDVFSDESVRALPRFSKSSAIIDAKDSNIITCDIIELLCENGDANNDGTTCPQISSSTEIEKKRTDASTSCRDCQLQEQEKSNVAVAKIRETKETLISDQDRELTERLNYYKSNVGDKTASMPGIFISTRHEETPILVDLTSEESKQITWKQTVFKQFGENSGENSDMGEEKASTRCCNKHMYICICT